MLQYENCPQEKYISERIEQYNNNLHTPIYGKGKIISYLIS